VVSLWASLCGVQDDPSAGSDTPRLLRCHEKDAASSTLDTLKPLKNPHSELPQRARLSTFGKRIEHLRTQRPNGGGVNRRFLVVYKQ
jgi:hypothetical protein